MYGPDGAGARVAVVAFTVAGVDTSTVGRLLDEEFAILVRVGLHCSPWAHRTLGTFPHGTVRVSLGHSNTREDVDRILQAVASLAGRSGARARDSNGAGGLR